MGSCVTATKQETIAIVSKECKESYDIKTEIQPLINIVSNEGKIDLNKPIVNCTKDDRKSVANCLSLQRTFIGLKQYGELNAIETDINSQKFIQFCTETYPHFLDDYVHFVQVHGDQLLQISTELEQNYGFKPCDIKTCIQLKRHYRRRKTNHDSTDENKMGDSKNDDAFQFYRDCYDRYHHVVFHLYLMGLRTHDQKLQNNEEIKQIEQNDDSWLDIYNDKNNKYIFNISQSESEQKHFINTDDTFLDAMFLFIQKHNDDIPNNRQEILKLYKYINEHEYDTDSIKADLDFIDIYESCIFDKNRNKTIIELMTKHISNVKLLSSAFSTGYIFYYWETFKPESGDLSDRNYVKPYYKSLKQEILSSNFIISKQWNHEVMIKANEYFHLQQMKKIKGGNKKHGTSVISLQHLISIILYCDF
eukprot:373535_1